LRFDGQESCQILILKKKHPKIITEEAGGSETSVWSFLGPHHTRGGGTWDGNNAANVTAIHCPRVPLFGG